MHYYAYPLLVFFLYNIVTTVFTSPNINCSTEGPCKCDLKGAGVIDLSGFESSIGKNSYVEALGIYRNEYRYYPCGVDVPWGNGACGSTATVCQHSFVSDSYISIGDTKQYNIIEAVANGRDSYIVIEYSTNSGNEARISRISIYCGGTESDDDLIFEDNISDLEYIFQFRSEKACPVPTPHSDAADGAVLLIVVLNVLFIIVVMYLIIGTLFTVFYKKARGLDVIPNWKFWKDVPFLLKDGVLFTFSCIPGARDRIGSRKKVL